MSRIHEFLDEAGVFFLATEEGKHAKVRPLGTHIERDGKEGRGFQQISSPDLKGTDIFLLIAWSVYAV